MISTEEESITIIGKNSTNNSNMIQLCKFSLSLTRSLA